MQVITNKQWAGISENFQKPSTNEDKSRAYIKGTLSNGDRYLTEYRKTSEGESAGYGCGHLMREYIEFVIVPDEISDAEGPITSGDPVKDNCTWELLLGLIELSDAEREDWRDNCLALYKGDKVMRQYIALAYTISERYAHRERGSVYA